MRHLSRYCVAALLILAAGPAASAQTPRAPAAPAAPAATQSVPAQPQQTTASFGDWTLRCTRLAAGGQGCELLEGISSQDRTIAQMAFGHAARGTPLQFTVLVPVNVTLATAPALLPARDGEASPVELAWRRCVPGGCIADGAVSDDALKRMRGWTEQARVTFVDSAGRTATLPFSPRGLGQALDALAHEDAG